MSLARAGSKLSIAMLIAATAITFGQRSCSAAGTGSTLAAPAHGLSGNDLAALARQYFPGRSAGVAQKRLVRLTRQQIDATARAVLPGYTLPSVSAFVARDGLQTNYEYAELLAVNGANGPGFAAWASAVADLVRKDPGVFSCSKGGSGDCAQRKAESFVTAAFRADLPADRIQRFIALFNASLKSAGVAEAAGDLVEVVLNSPHFLFRKETDTDAYGRLVPAQLLQAVTYTLADVPPEALGLDSSRASEHIGDGRSAAAAIRAIAASAPARDKLTRFLAAWLELKDANDFTISRETFAEFTTPVATALNADARAFLRSALEGEAPSLKAVTQALETIASPASAALYGVPASRDGKQSRIAPDPSQRLGIFSHPAFIASHSGPTDERPYKRGVFWVRKAMCMELKAPPKDLHISVYDAPGATQRQRLEKSTEAAACVGCHKVINPFAFFMESYDALGRWRASDNGLPIDTSIIINFLDDEPQETRSSVDALKVLTGSEMFKQCFARQMFRFYMARSEEDGDDPALRAMYTAFAEGDRQDITAALRTLVSSDRIVQRR